MTRASTCSVTCRSAPTSSSCISTATPLDLKPDVIAAAIDEAHKHNMPAAVHIVYLKDAKMAIDRGVDVIAHSVRDMDIDAATIAEMKRRNVALIPTLSRDYAVYRLRRPAGLLQGSVLPARACRSTSTKSTC